MRSALECGSLSGVITLGICLLAMGIGCMFFSVVFKNLKYSGDWSEPPTNAQEFSRGRAEGAARMAPTLRKWGLALVSAGAVALYVGLLLD